MLERRQRERREHLARLQALIDREQLKLDNLKAQPPIEAPATRGGFTLVGGRS